MFLNANSVVARKTTQRGFYEEVCYANNLPFKRLEGGRAFRRSDRHGIHVARSVAPPPQNVPDQRTDTPPCPGPVLLISPLRRPRSTTYVHPYTKLYLNEAKSEHTHVHTQPACKFEPTTELKPKRPKTRRKRSSLDGKHHLSAGQCFQDADGGTTPWGPDCSAFVAEHGTVE